MEQAEPGARILIVEDEWLIAELFSDILRDEGYEIMGPAATVRAACALIEKEEISAAILDLTLAGETSYPAARMLNERRIPFLFVSGHSEHNVLPEFQHAPLLMKPVEDEKLPIAIRKLLSART